VPLPHEAGPFYTPLPLSSIKPLPVDQALVPAEIDPKRCPTVVYEVPQAALSAASPALPVPYLPWRYVCKAYFAWRMGSV
jgi:hypothetical protein